MYSKHRTSKYPLLAYAALSAITLILCVIGCFWTWSQIRILYHHVQFVEVKSHRRAWFRLLTTCILFVTTALQAVIAEFGACLPYVYICCKEYHYKPTQDPLRVVTTSENAEAVTTFLSDGRSSISSSSIRLYSRRIYKENRGTVTAYDDYEEYDADYTEENDGTIQHVYAANVDLDMRKYYSLENISKGNEGKIYQVYANALALHKVENYPQRGSSDENEEQIQHVYAEDVHKNNSKYYSVGGSIAEGDSKVEHTYAEELSLDKLKKTYKRGSSQGSEGEIRKTYTVDLEIDEKKDYSYSSCNEMFNGNIHHLYAEQKVTPKYYYIPELHEIEHTYYEEANPKT